MNQARPRLSAVAVEPVRRLAHGRVVRAVVYGVEARSAALKLARQSFVNLADQRLVEVAARDAGLVRDEYGEPARRVERAHGLRREGEDAVARDVVDVAYFLRDRPVAVNEDCAPRAARLVTSTPSHGLHATHRATSAPRRASSARAARA